MDMVPGMAKIHPGATLTPHFREFLPGWIACQPWYTASGVPALTLVGAFRLEDPAGAVGIETHLLSDGSTLYQVPMTYRGAPLDGAEHALITTAEHSVLGRRWIYDAPADPVWVEQVLRLVRTEGVTEASAKRGAAFAEARGQRLDRSAALAPGAVGIDLVRSLAAGEPVLDPDAIGVVTARWHQDGPDALPVSGWLAVLRTLPAV